MNNQFYQLAWTGYTTSLIQGSTGAANALLSAAAPTLFGAVSLLIIVLGTMMIIGKMDLSTGITWCFRAIIIAAIMIPVNYNEFVMNTFLTTVPNWIASAMTGDVPGLTVAQSMDLFRSAIDHMAAALTLAATQGDLTAMISRMIHIDLIDSFADGLITMCFVVDLLTTALVAIVAPLGAVLLIAYLFAATRHWSERWIGKLASLMLLQLMIAVLLKVIVAQIRVDILAAETFTTSGVDLDAAISAFWLVSLDIAIGFMILIALPAMAAALGGGHVASSLVLAPMRMTTAAAGRMEAAIARGVKAGLGGASRSQSPTTA